jgi:ribA/ribD-fused uncharacterized protein
MIKFWKTREAYGCLSNFSKHSIIVDGKMYSTTEHYYQSKKFEDPVYQEIIRTLKTPREAKDIASGDKPYLVDGIETPMPKLRSDWESVKYGIMKDALRHKVQQNPEVRKTLLETGSEEIAEDTPYDYIWGIGVDGSGKNLLGKAWMEIRDELRNGGEASKKWEGSVD